jgi:hypothetical protein
MSPWSEADLERLSEALARLLASWWRRREQEKAAGLTPAAREEAHDDGTVARSPS